MPQKDYTGMSCGSGRPVCRILGSGQARTGVGGISATVERRRVGRRRQNLAIFCVFLAGPVVLDSRLLGWFAVFCGFCAAFFPASFFLVSIVRKDL